MTSDRMFSSHQYIEYIPGELNVILSVPHGGHLKPQSIPDRDAGALVKGHVVYNHKHQKLKDAKRWPVRVKCDLYTTELAICISDELYKLTNRRPHVVLNRVHRGKLDCNCEREKATFDVPEATEAWDAFHNFIETAKNTIQRGIFLDLHGHTHEENWVELGYTISKEDMDRRDFLPNESSIATLVKSSTHDPYDLINGKLSFGGILAEYGYASVPSPWNPTPSGGNYYTGGYNTERHGSKYGGEIDSIQIESPKWVRNKNHFRAYGKSLAMTINEFYKQHYT